MITEGLIIKGVEGLGCNVLDQKKQTNAFLGTSLNMNHFFSKKHVGMYIDWALENCHNFLLAIDDFEERNNYMVFKGLGEDNATDLVLQRGQDTAKSYRRILSRYSSTDRSRIRIVQTADLFQEPRCLEVTSQLTAVFQEDPQFRDDVYSQLFTNIGSKVEEWRKTVPDSDYQNGLPTLARYLLEELGATLFIREEMGYPVEVYPGSSMKVVRNLYDGSYPNLTDSLELKGGYGYIYLDIEPTG